MAYPFAQMPTLGEFVAWAANYGVSRKHTPTIAEGPRGPVRFSYLQREAGTPFVVLPDMSDESRLAPNVIRSYCLTLKIPPKAWGLTLG